MNTPKQATDEQIAKLFDQELTPAMALNAALQRLHDIMHKKPDIDLRGRTLDVRYEFHGTFRGKQQWTAWDDRTYDGDESSIGSGESKEDALVDLLDKMDSKAEQPKPRMPRLVHSSPDSPPEYKDDHITFDDGLTDDDAG